MERRTLAGGLLALAMLVAPRLGAADPASWVADPCLDRIVDRAALAELLAVELGAQPEPADAIVSATCPADRPDLVELHVGDRRIPIPLGDLPRDRRARALALALADAVTSSGSPPPAAIAPPEAPASPSPASDVRIAAPPERPGPPGWRIALRVAGGGARSNGTDAIGGGAIAVEHVLGGAVIAVGAQTARGPTLRLASGFVGTRLEHHVAPALAIGVEIVAEVGGRWSSDAMDPTSSYVGGGGGVVVRRALSTRWDLTLDASYRYLACKGIDASLVTAGLGIRVGL